MKDDGYKIRDEYGVYYITFAVVEWVDVFSRKLYTDIVLDSLKFCIENKQLKLFAWCIMSNHVPQLSVEFVELSLDFRRVSKDIK